ncbi:unnamed protein product [Rotaria sp. Silwood2]|nr:unnamed protein product [Rotaria sp. Silwood2]CAF2891765.1 unnamed protein product [Rotaria sp. Silwood2]CAF4055945.1 unnamed protein product [Rotaria sp. Silwood2]CAF4057694.1 unnamed protein product [Rotaria sp. Silwood2]CAF4097384.1 unnamed protein product [Rotaria sp. Silwood2]
MKHYRVCIVGGGASGLACARVLASDDYDCEPTIFEKNPFICGQWHYDPDGTSETTAVYKALKTNLRCSVMQFSDFPFPNNEPESHVGYKEVEEYLMAYAEKHQLFKYIVLNAEVNSIDETFTVTYTVRLGTENEISKRPNQNLLEKNEHYAVYSEQFDAICVANGHYSQMYIPDDIPGLHSKTFPIHHSRSYREADHYRDKCVIVVGASHSGIDISGELALVAKQVILSMKEENQKDLELVLNQLQLSGKQLCTDYLSTTFSIEPPIERIDKDIVYFKNQTSIKPDLIIFATGYEYRMPFLQGKLQVDQNCLLKDHYVYPLYKQLFHADFPNGTLSFLAIPYRIVPFPLAEIQSHIVARVLCGKIFLPSRDEMIYEIDHSLLPRNRRYHYVNMINYTENLFEIMNESNKFFNYIFTIDNQRCMPQYSFDEIPQIESRSRVAIVTGANEGIGKVTARELVRKGWHVIVASRNEEKAQHAINSIRQEINMSDAPLDFIQLDLSSFTSIRKFVDEFHQRQLPLHLLINNAGLFLSEFQLSEIGEELQFATNHLGHFLLTNLLLDDLRACIPSRIVIVSSGAHLQATNIELDDQKRNQPFPTSSISKFRAGFQCYRQSKLANVMMCTELVHRLGPESKVYCNTLHPGVIKTSIWRNNKWSGRLMTPFMRSVDNGAMTTLYLATHPDIEQNNIRGTYFVPSKILPPPYCRPAIAEMNPIAQDRQQCQQLWELSQRLTKLNTTI